MTTIHSVEIKPAIERPTRFSGLLWGPAGVGKTTLACTLPGKKLLVNFDPDGPTSIAGFDNVDVLDYAPLGHSITNTFKDEINPLGIKDIIANYDSLIIDSITNATDKSLDAGVASPMAKGTSVERPAPTSYQIRNRLTLKLVKNVLRLTARHNKHCIFIAHQAAPEKNDDGVVLFITVALGGSLPDSVPIDYSEVWALYEVPGKGKHIAIRPCRSRQPMKTRMFTTTGDPEFRWKFDPEAMKGDTIEKWLDLWIKNDKKKIPLPI